MMKKYLVVGGGQAGVQTAISLRNLDKSAEILVISNECFPPYHRPPLSKDFLLSDFPESRLFIRSFEALGAQNINYLSQCRVEKIDRGFAQIGCSNGISYEYDSLVLATGARPIQLRVPGAELPGILYLRSLSEAKLIRSHSSRARKIVIVGGGFIGLEVAASMRKLGKEVVLIEAQKRVLNRVVAPVVADFFMDLHQRHGVDIISAQGVSHFCGNDSVSSVVLKNGVEIETDLVIVGIGVKPNDELAAESGLNIDDGILVDQCGKTNDEKIYAAGDCCKQHNDWASQFVRLESVPNAQEQGKLVASAIAGKLLPTQSVPWFWSHQFDVKLQIAGLNHNYTDVVVHADSSSDSFNAVYLKDERVVAVDCINQPALFMKCKRLMQSQRDCSIQDFKAIS